MYTIQELEIIRNGKKILEWRVLYNRMNICGAISKEVALETANDLHLYRSKVIEVRKI